MLIGSLFMIYQYAQQAAGVLGAMAANYQGLARMQTDFASAAIIREAPQPQALAVAPDAAFDDDPADAEIIDTIKELIETRVRPAVAQDGGDIVYRGYKDGTLFLAMQGACAGCPSSAITLKRGIESLIRHYVPEVEAVEAV